MDQRRQPDQGLPRELRGPFSGIYHSIAGTDVVNVIFMVGLLGIGVALLLGVAMRLACAAGALMVVLMWSVTLPPASNPFMDDHLVYAILFVGLAMVGAGKTLGLGERWSRLRFVERHRWLT